MKVERGIPLVERIIERNESHAKAHGLALQKATPRDLDALESELMVELPPTVRRFLEFDFTFRTFGQRWRGRGRFGRTPENAHARRTSIRKLAEAMTELGWTSTPLRQRVIRLPNLPGEPWNALYLGEPRRDGELPILGLAADGTSVSVHLRYTAFDLYLVEQSGLLKLSDEMRLDDVEAYMPLNSELRDMASDVEYSASF
jgi:hypothetical protein